MLDFDSQCVHRSSASLFIEVASSPAPFFLSSYLRLFIYLKISTISSLFHSFINCLLPVKIRIIVIFSKIDIKFNM
jgi:hypothetical protein